MQRLLSAARLKRCASVRGLLARAGAPPTAACVLEPSAGGARSLLRSSLARAHSTAAAPQAHADVVCACVLERLPIVMPPQPAWELEYQDWRYEKLRATFKQYPKELVEPKTVDEDESKQSWTAASVSQAPQQLQSAERKPDEFLYLLVRAGGAWQFPQAEHRAGETARQVAERALAQSASGLDVYFVGNAPAAHHAQPQRTLFFLRASYLGGSPQLPSGSGVTDWAWVTKSELSEYVGAEMHALLSKAL